MTGAEKQSILLVEDEEAVLMLLGNMLEQEGYTVLRAKDGIEGAEIALAKHPDLIVADLKMPKMDGMGMIGEIRNDTWGKSAKIIILTNAADTETIAEGIEKETLFFILKGDSSLESVVEKIKSHLDPSLKKA